MELLIMYEKVTGISRYKYYLKKILKSSLQVSTTRTSVFFSKPPKQTGKRSSKNIHVKKCHPLNSSAAITTNTYKVSKKRASKKNERASEKERYAGSKELQNLKSFLFNCQPKVGLGKFLLQSHFENSKPAFSTSI